MNETTLTPRETLRSAADLMRTHAAAASPGPWCLPAPNDEYVNRGDVVSDGEPGSRFIICEHAGPDAAHIASWHPGITTLVADLFEHLAEDEDHVVSWQHGQALKIAREYLASAAPATNLTPQPAAQDLP